ncbi:endochitinase-like [Anopheles nili]|uniref:endochitinase-like n=1 Tax=Anopheles nili TaxID=185578 RepID=UPI00237AEE51|nr:endochitinase-like [Anopheles nili]
MPKNCVAIVVALLTVGLTVGAATETNGRVVCSFSSAAANRANEYEFRIEDIPLPLCTHVVYDGMQLDVFTLELIPGNPPFDVLENGWEKFSDLKRTDPDVKLLLSIRSPFLARAASTAENRGALIKSILSYMDWMRLDGIELLWLEESFDSSDSTDANESIYTLLEELKRAFETAGHPTWEVIVMLEIERNQIDHERLCKLVDFVHFVAISEQKVIDPPGTKEASFTYRLFNIGDRKHLTLDRAVHYWIERKCPANKLVLGVLFPARTYTLPEGVRYGPSREPGRACAQTQEPGLCGYFELCQLLNGTDWTVGWDDVQGIFPRATDTTDQWVAYENEISVGRKGYIARSNGLAGVYGLSIDQDDYRGKCGDAFPLTKALWRSFLHTLDAKFNVSASWNLN